MARSKTSYKMAVYLKGLSDVQRTVSKWQAGRYHKVQQLIKKTANNIKRNARRRAPVKTGRLRKSIMVFYGPDRLTAYVRAVAPHSHLVEYGSAVMGSGPRPFLEPAATGQVEKYKKEIAKIFGEV